MKNPFITNTLVSRGKNYSYYSLPELGRELGEPLERLPVSLRIVLESLCRHCGGEAVTREDVERLARWNPKVPSFAEIPFTVARIILQDFTGVPLLVDLAAMRSAVARLGGYPGMLEPTVPVDLVIDHSVQVDFNGTPQAFAMNLAVEIQRNRERYELLKWGEQAFRKFNVVPPGIGIVHQVNLEYLAKGVFSRPLDGDSHLVYPDSLVGTDSHTTMINGLGIVGWGVGGIEAESGMLGQPIYFPTPEVVGMALHGSLREGVTATDLVLHITERLRKAKVVGKFVEFHGVGARSLSVADRATIANMAPEYGATMGYFPVDEETLHYLRLTGRPEELVELVRDYYMAQGLFGIPEAGQITYSQLMEMDLADVDGCVAGPRRPQDRIPIGALKNTFINLLTQPVTAGGYGKTSIEPLTDVDLDCDHVVVAPAHPAGGGSQEPSDPALAQAKNTSQTTEQEMANNRPTPDTLVVKPVAQVGQVCKLGNGSVVIAAITSCTNTSNPAVMLAAGLLAKKAVERGLETPRYVKASLAPGSRVVTDYYARTGLQPYLDKLGFYLVGYGCTTCIGNSGPLAVPIEKAIEDYALVAASVLSGNRNFEARIHASIKANFLMSPPLVVAYALAGRVDIDLTSEPIGHDKDGQPVLLKEIWPSRAEVSQLLREALQPEVFRRFYSHFAEQNPAWKAIAAPTGELYQWNPRSTYIQEPPFFEGFTLEPAPVAPIREARALAIFGDSITTDHISPAGSIKPNSPAGLYLQQHGVPVNEFNTYGSRRGNDKVMTRGTFANLRIRNLMVPGVEGGYTRNLINGEITTIFEAAQFYASRGIPLLVFGGKEYGTGSSRDWAAKGTRLLGVRAVIAESFERIHRSNLVGMGVLPCTFLEGVNAQSLGLDGSEIFTLEGVGDNLQPRQELELRFLKEGRSHSVPVMARLDTPIEVSYYRHGGILPYVLRHLLRNPR